MGEKTLNWRIISATLFSVVLIVGAYVFARGVGSPPVAQASTESALLQAIATRDSTGDGLPDWQKSLYGIPLNSTTTDYFHLGMTDGEAVARGLIVPKAVADITIATSSSQSVIAGSSLPPVPAGGTLTDSFSKNFFTLYMSAKSANGGKELSSSQVDALASQTLDSLASMVAPSPDYKSAGDLTVAGSGADALKTFAASIEAVILQNKKVSGVTKNEILYLQDVIQNGDTSALASLVAVAKMYRDSAAGIAALPVPAELAADDLTLINAMMHASEIASDFARINTDPLATMFALNQYTQLDQSLFQTFTNISNIYAKAGITLPVGTPGATFLNTLNQYRAAATSANQTP